MGVLMTVMCVRAEAFDKIIYFDQIVEQNDLKRFKEMSEKYKTEITLQVKAEALSIAVSTTNLKDTYPFTEYLVNEMHADINMTYDNIKFTPFHKAVKNGDIKTVTFLLSKGAKVNVRNKNDSTPLMAACFSGYKEIVILLLEKKADYKVKDFKGKTALQYAKDRGHQDIVDLLIKAGAKE